MRNNLQRGIIIIRFIYSADEEKRRRKMKKKEEKRIRSKEEKKGENFPFNPKWILGWESFNLFFCHCYCCRCLRILQAEEKGRAQGFTRLIFISSYSYSVSRSPSLSSVFLTRSSRKNERSTKRIQRSGWTNTIAKYYIVGEIFKRQTSEKKEKSYDIHSRVVWGWKYTQNQHRWMIQILLQSIEWKFFPFFFFSFLFLQKKQVFVLVGTVKEEETDEKEKRKRNFFFFLLFLSFLHYFSLSVGEDGKVGKGKDRKEGGEISPKEFLMKKNCNLNYFHFFSKFFIFFKNFVFSYKFLFSWKFSFFSKKFFIL